MKHPYTVVWLAEGCVVQALPTPRGKRNALLLNRGLVTAVLRLSEDDYNELLASGPVSSSSKEGKPGGKGPSPSDDGRSAGPRTPSGSRMGVVPSNDATARKPTGAQGRAGTGL